MKIENHGADWKIQQSGSPPGAEELAEALRQNTKLDTLDLANNQHLGPLVIGMVIFTESYGEIKGESMGKSAVSMIAEHCRHRFVDCATIFADIPRLHGCDAVS